MELQETRAVVMRCFREEAASCECVCPFHLEIRALLKKMARGRWPAAYRDLSTAVLFPAVVAALCPQPCRDACQRKCVGDEALNMAMLERACVEFNAGTAAESFSLPPKAQRIAVVGAGPAGLACALVLARKKYQVTVYERGSAWGGYLRTRPEFPAFDADFAKQFAGQEVVFRYNTEADREELGTYDAVYVSTGDGGEDYGLRESWDGENFTSSRSGWFLGGGVCGMPLMESIAAANRLSQLIEAYLQTGRAALIVEQSAACEGHMLPHPGEESRPPVVPADLASGYTKDEAREEAGRCMQCVCDACMSGCELMKKYKKTPLTLAANISGDSHTTPPFSNCEATRQTYSCNICGLCADRCPEGVDLSKLFLMSREDRWKQDKWVPGIFDYWLRNLDFNDTDGFYAEPGQHEYLFFPGCQLSAVLPEQTMAAWKFLRGKLSAGIVLGCCGAPAVWAGDLQRKARNLDKLKGAWKAMGCPTVITACATCAEMLQKQIEGIKTVSLYELLLSLDAPKAAVPFEKAAVFDPCSARRSDAMHTAVAELSKRSGCETEDLPGESCCGHGGLMRLADPALYEKITDQRAAQSELPYIVYCANCLEVFRRKRKEAEHVLTVVFGGGDGQLPSLKQKRENAQRLKVQVIRETEGICLKHAEKPWDNREFSFSENALGNMEARLISEDDICEAIYRAEEEIEYFEDGSGLRTACLQRKVLTFWADYRVTGENSYEIVSAYCHRMHLDGEEAAK